MIRTASGTLSDGTPFTIQVGDTPVSPPPPSPPPPSPPPPSPPPPPTGGFVLGQVPFTATSAWNKLISSNAIYTNLSWPANTGWNYVAAWDTYSPAVYVSASTDPIVAVPIPNTWGWLAQTLHIRMPVGANGAQGSDGEMLVVDGTTVHNFWQFKRTSNTTGTAASYGACDVLTGTGFGTPSPFKGAGICAIGASMLGGLIVQAETDKGAILHAIALRCDAPFLLSGFVAPAIAGDGSSSTGSVKEGQLLGIPLATAMPSGLSPLGQQVFVASQKYGMIVNDKTGGTYGPRVQANAYDDATIVALIKDMPKIIPLLKKVS